MCGKNLEKELMSLKVLNKIYIKGRRKKKD